MQTDPIYASAVGNAGEMERAIRVCLMGSEACMQLTFDVAGCPAGGFEEAWCIWRNKTFGGILAPHLIHVFLAAQKQAVAEIIVFDKALDGALRADAADRSAAAGCRFHASLQGARHVKLTDKLQQAVMQQEIRGHHATYFACEAAMFHVPLMHLLPAYLFAEWRSARAAAGLSREGSSLQAFESLCGDALLQAAKLLSDVAGGPRTIGVCA